MAGWPMPSGRGGIDDKRAGRSTHCASPRALAPEGRKPVAHGASRGKLDARKNQPRRSVRDAAGMSFAHPGLGGFHRDANPRLAPMVSTRVVRPSRAAGSALFRPRGATTSSRGWSAAQPVDQFANTRSAPEGRRTDARVTLRADAIGRAQAVRHPPPLPGRIRLEATLPRVPLRSTRGYCPRPLRGRVARVRGVVWIPLACAVGT